MITESFAAGASIIHRLDPRLRLIVATVYACIMATTGQPAALAAALAIGMLFVALARLDARRVAKKLAAPAFFLLFFWVLTPFTYIGEPLTTIGPLTVYRPGVLLCTQITIKSLAILLVLISLVATMPIATLGHALQGLKLPAKLVFLLLMTYRYIDVLQTEYQRIALAAKIRGFRPHTRMHTYRTYAYMVGMLFVRAAQRSENVNRAMRCRGFHGRFYSIFNFKSDPFTPWFALLNIGLMTALIGLEWVGRP